ncbi:MAG: hypothetical protein IE933_05345 [Sphingomonadales bacterium]|nr:hypothetical protein [Sphingomonadales bacterium]MBD3772853.1 hypothetical protein [Paracoccaceae bacterium]
MTFPRAPTHRYRHSGLCFASSLALPEWEAFADSGTGEPDVTILLDRAGDASGPPDYDPSFAAETLSFSIDGIGRWEVAGGATIRIVPAAGVQERELRLFTLGSAWGAIGYQRGFPMLHGSAVAITGGAALFCGAQEHGKSTTGAALLARGHALLADDLSRVDPPGADGQPAMLHPSAARIKLWDSAVAHFGWQDREKVRDYYRDNKFHFHPPAGAPATEPVPLRAVHLLEWGDEIAIERVQGGQALPALAQAAMYRKPFLQAMGLLADQMFKVTQIAGAARIYRVTRPRDFSRLDELCERLEALWAS